MNYPACSRLGTKEVVWRWRPDPCDLMSQQWQHREMAGEPTIDLYKTYHEPTLGLACEVSYWSLKKRYLFRDSILAHTSHQCSISSSASGSSKALGSSRDNKPCHCTVWNTVSMLVGSPFWCENYVLTYRHDARIQLSGFVDSTVRLA